MQNRTNVQIKGGGGQRPFEQCSKKLHFSLMMASLIAMLWSISLHFQKWPRQSNYEIIIFDIINAHQSCVINLTPFFHFHPQGKDVRWSRDSIAFDQNTCSDVVLIWRFLMFFLSIVWGCKIKASVFLSTLHFCIFLSYLWAVIHSSTY